MTDVHTISESIALADMAASAELLGALLVKYAGQGA